MALVMGSTCRADSGGGRSGRGGTREMKQRSCLDVLPKLSCFCSSTLVLEQVGKSSCKTLWWKRFEWPVDPR